ncbi:MAG: type III pantothenate kinase [Rhodospirillales bacterium]
MLLAVDAGNTETVFAVFAEGETPAGAWRISTKPNRTADEYAVWLDHLMNLSGVDKSGFTAAVIASVVPRAVFSLKDLCRRYFKVEPLIISAETADLGIHVLTDRPEEVGADRLVNAAAAAQHYGGPAVIIDFGTATTFDVIDAGGNYRGGVIAPGVNLSVEALMTAAARLPRIAVTRPEKVIGTNTVEAMQSGVFWGYASMIEGVTRRIREEYGGDMKVIATGGLATLFEGAVNIFDAVDPDLTLKGLLAIHRINA